MLLGHIIPGPAELESQDFSQFWASMICQLLHSLLLVYIVLLMGSQLLQPINLGKRLVVSKHNVKRYFNTLFINSPCLPGILLFSQSTYSLSFNTCYFLLFVIGYKNLENKIHLWNFIVPISYLFYFATFSAHQQLNLLLQFYFSISQAWHQTDASSENPKHSH